jgi:hypothetical protein
MFIVVDGGLFSHGEGLLLLDVLVDDTVTGLIRISPESTKVGLLVSVRMPAVLDQDRRSARIPAAS